MCVCFLCLRDLQQKCKVQQLSCVKEQSPCPALFILLEKKGSKNLKMKNKYRNAFTTQKISKWWIKSPTNKIGQMIQRKSDYRKPCAPRKAPICPTNFPLHVSSSSRSFLTSSISGLKGPEMPHSLLVGSGTTLCKSSSPIMPCL